MVTLSPSPAVEVTAAGTEAPVGVSVADLPGAAPADSESKQEADLKGESESKMEPKVVYETRTEYVDREVVVEKTVEVRLPTHRCLLLVSELARSCSCCRWDCTF